MAFLHSHVDAVGNNKLNSRKRQRREAAKTQNKNEHVDSADTKLPKCKDTAWFYSPKQHVYNLCRDFFPPATVASTPETELFNGGRGRDVCVEYLLLFRDQCTRLPF